MAMASIGTTNVNQAFLHWHAEEETPSGQINVTGINHRFGNHDGICTVDALRRSRCHCARLVLVRI